MVRNFSLNYIVYMLKNKNFINALLNRPAPSIIKKRKVEMLMKKNLSNSAVFLISDDGKLSSGINSSPLQTKSEDSPQEDGHLQQLENLNKVIEERGSEAMDEIRGILKNQKM